MDWQVKPIAHTCAASGQELKIKDTVVCIVYKTVDGSIERRDVLKDNALDFKTDGLLLGRWTREVKDRGEEEKAVRAQLLASREEFFLSLFDDPEDPTGDKALLKHILAMLLERKRIVRATGPAQNGFTPYQHAESKQIFMIPTLDLQPSHIQKISQSLELLVG